MDTSSGAHADADAHEVAKGDAPAPKPTPKRRRARFWTLLVLAVVAVVALPPAIAIGSAFVGMASLRDGRTIGPVHTIKLGYVAAFEFSLGDGKVALVDTGPDAKGEALLAALAARGISSDAVRAIFVTHGHGDHIAAIGRFPRAEVYALATAIPMIEGRTVGRSPVSRLLRAKETGVHVAHALSDGERVDLGDARVQVFAVPGHTAGSAAYLVDGVLILGDAAGAKKSGRVAGPPWVFSDDPAQGRESLQGLSMRLSRDYTPVRALVFAHSDAIEADDVLWRLYRAE